MSRTLPFLGLIVAAVWTLPANQRFQTGGNASKQPVLVWTMSGGIAAFCDELSVWANGKVQSHTCKFGGRIKSGKLGKEDVGKLTRWAKAFSSVSIDNRDAGVADSLVVTVKLQGSGTERPSDSEKQEMLQWGQTIYNANRP